MKFQTLCIHGNKTRSTNRADTSGGVSVPVHLAATYVHPSIENPSDYIYSRVKNPTREAAEHIVAALEGATEGFGFSSGMAAIATVMELFEPGAHIIATDDLFGGSIRLFTTIIKRHGLEFDFVDTGDIAAVTAKLRPNTKAIYIETPTNPMTMVTDIAAVRAAVGEGVLLIVDNTFLSPYFQNPLALGADIVIHSGTKYLGGHSDALAGFAVLNCPALRQRLTHLHTSIGATLSPMDSFLVVRGIKTLAVRLDRAQENAIALANWLLAHPKINAVYYTGLPTHPGHEIMKKQARGFGAMMSFETDTPQTARNIVEHVKVISYAESLGCVNSLITIPVLCTHADVPEEERLARGINDRLVRFSVGIENAQDLIEDLAQAMEV